MSRSICIQKSLGKKGLLPIEITGLEINDAAVVKIKCDDWMWFNFFGGARTQSTKRFRYPAHQELLHHLQFL